MRFRDGFMERGDQVLLGMCPFRNTPPSARLCLGDQLRPSASWRAFASAQAVGDLADFAAAVAAGCRERPIVTGHHAMETLRIGDGNCRHAITAPAVDKILDEGAQPPATPGFGVVHLVDDDDAGTLASSHTSTPARSRFYAISALTKTTAASTEGGRTACGEHMEPEYLRIDFDALPLGKSDGILHGYAGQFFVS